MIFSKYYLQHVQLEAGFNLILTVMCTDH